MADPDPDPDPDPDAAVADSPADPGPAAEHRFYGELAEWWPLISPPEEYVEEAAALAEVLAGAGPTLLELGSGGGHNAVHLKRSFALTLVDLSDDMLAVSRRLNPECTHVQGDLRTVRVGTRFDAVLVHDAIDYMITEDDLRRALATVAAHCRPGGTAVLVPDQTAETFSPGTGHGGTDGPDGRGVRYLEWTWDPDPADTWALTEYAFILRSADGTTRAVHETHRTGLFPRDVWLGVLADAGFEPEARPDPATDGARTLFIGRRHP